MSDNAHEPVFCLFISLRIAAVILHHKCYYPLLQTVSLKKSSVIIVQLHSSRICRKPYAVSTYKAYIRVTVQVDAVSGIIG